MRRPLRKRFRLTDRPRAFERTTARLTLRPPNVSDARALRDYYERNADRFDRWEAPRSRDVDDHARAIAAHAASAARDGHPSQFLAFFKERARIEGSESGEESGPAAIVTLTGFDHHGGSASIDYTADAACEGRGLASEAVASVVAYALESIGLTSVSAYYDPENVRSAALLAHLGFHVVATMPPMPHLRGALRPKVYAVKRRPDAG